MDKERRDEFVRKFYAQYAQIRQAMKRMIPAIDFGTAMPMRDGVPNFEARGPLGTVFHHSRDLDLHLANIGVTHRFGSLIFHFGQIYDQCENVKSCIDRAASCRDGDRSALLEFGSLALAQQFIFDDIILNSASMFDYAANVIWKLMFKHWRMWVDRDKLPVGKNLPKHIDWMKLAQFSAERKGDPIRDAMRIDNTIKTILKIVKKNDSDFVGRLARYRNEIAHSVFDMPFAMTSTPEIRPVGASALFMSIVGAPGANVSDGVVSQMEAAASVIDRCGTSLVAIVTELSEVMNLNAISRNGFRES